MVDFSIFPRENMDWGNKMYSGTLQNVVQNLCAVPCRKCIVITIVLQNASVKIEVEEFENAKATSLLCLLGVGVGIGSLLLYKVYTRFFPSTKSCRNRLKDGKKSCTKTNSTANTNTSTAAAKNKKNTEITRERERCCKADLRIRKAKRPNSMGNTFTIDTHPDREYFNSESGVSLGRKSLDSACCLSENPPLSPDSAYNLDSFEILDTPRLKNSGGASNDMKYKQHRLPSSCSEIYEHSFEVIPENCMQQNMKGIPSEKVESSKVIPTAANLFNSQSSGIGADSFLDSSSEMGLKESGSNGQCSESLSTKNEKLLDDLENPPGSSSGETFVEEENGDTEPVDVTGKTGDSTEIDDEPPSDLSEIFSSPQHMPYASSEGSEVCREWLNKRCSIASDLESFSGVETADSEIFDIKEEEFDTTETLTRLDQELKDVRGCIDDLSDKLTELNSRDNMDKYDIGSSLIFKSAMKNKKFHRTFGVMQKHRLRRRHKLRSTSLPVGMQASTSYLQGDNRHSFNGFETDEGYMWDEQYGKVVPVPSSADEAAKKDQESQADTSTERSYNMSQDGEEFIYDDFSPMVAEGRMNFPPLPKDDFGFGRGKFGFRRPSDLDSDATFETTDTEYETSSAFDCYDDSSAVSVPGGNSVSARLTKYANELADLKMKQSELFTRLGQLENQKQGSFDQVVPDSSSSYDLLSSDHYIDPYHPTCMARAHSLSDIESIMTCESASVSHNSVISSPDKPYKNLLSDSDSIGQFCDAVDDLQEDGGSVPCSPEDLIDNRLPNQTQLTSMGTVNLGNPTAGHVTSVMDGGTATYVPLPSSQTSSISSQQNPATALDDNVDAQNANGSTTSDYRNPQAERDRPKSLVQNITEKLDINAYIDKEWKGDTAKALRIREGYKQVAPCAKCHHLRRVRGDNYCAVRAALYQALVNNLPVLQHIGHLQQTVKRLEVFTLPQYSYLHGWSFGRRLPRSSVSVLPNINNCIQTLFEQFTLMSKLRSYQEREEYLYRALNQDPSLDIRLLESAKILMMVTAIELYHDYVAGRDVPTFAWLLFARDTSQTPQALFLNHLNLVGDAAGLEMVEMFLLGHTLGVTLQVFRPSQFGEEDFISYYPDDKKQVFPLVSLIAEDDRHYNVAVP